MSSGRSSDGTSSGTSGGGETEAMAAATGEVEEEDSKTEDEMVSVFFLNNLVLVSLYHEIYLYNE